MVESSRQNTKQMPEVSQNAKQASAVRQAGHSAGPSRMDDAGSHSAAAGRGVSAAASLSGQR